MSFRLQREQSLTANVHRIAREQCDRALDSVEAGDLDTGVHELRKRCKKIRGLVRLVRPGFEGYPDANARFRDIARSLSDGRDRAAMLETDRALRDAFDDGVDGDALIAVRRGLEQYKRAADLRDELSARLRSAVDQLRRAREELIDWRVDDDWEAVIGGIEKTYGRARRMYRASSEEPTTANLHQWRKRAKYHRYHMKLTRGAWPTVLMARRDEAKRLSDLLGDNRDLAVLRGHLLEDPDRYGGQELLRTYVALIDGRRRRLRADALALGERLCAEKPSKLGDRIRALLDSWRAS